MVKKFLIDIIDEDEFFGKFSKFLDERNRKILCLLKEQQEPLMTTAQCMEFLHVSRTKLHYMIKNGQIPFFRVGNSLRFSKKEVRKTLSINNSKIN